MFAAADVPIEWDVTPLSTKTAVPGKSLLTEEVKESIHANKVGLKGTPSHWSGVGKRVSRRR